MNGNVAETIDKNNKDVNFIDGTATTARNSGGNITFDVNVDGTTISVKDNKVSANTTDLTVNNGKVNTPTNTDALITANEVAETINNSGFTLTTSQTGTGKATGTSNELVNPGETVTIEAGNNIEVTQAAGKVTVATSMAPTFNTVTINNPNITTPTPNAPAVPAPTVNINNAATIGDVLNTGWNLQGNGKAVDFVQPYETVNFKDGNATTATVTSDGTTSNVKYDVNVDNSTITINDNGQLTANIPEIQYGAVDAEEVGSLFDSGGTPGLVFSDNLVEAINKSGWNVTAAGANATGASNQLINPGETVTFIAGKNMTLVQDGNTFTYATADNVEFTSITIDDGDTTTAPITINAGGINVGGTTIANVKSNLPDTYNQNVYNTTKQATTASQPLPTNLTLTNAATVGDVLNAGWNLQGDGAAKDFVKPYDTVNFAHGTGTTVKVDVDANGEVSTVKYSVNVDNKTITTRPQTDDNGDVIIDNEGNPLTELTVNTTKISANPIGTVSVTGDTTSLATAGDIANAINESGWNVTAAAGNDGAGNELVQPGETVTFDAGKNMKLTQAGQSFTYATADDVNFNSVQFGDNGPKITNNGGNINVAGPNGEPVKITNVKAGEDGTDAVNVSQLNDTVATSKETVVSTDKSVTVTTGKNANGAAEFDLSVKVDGTTIKNGDNGLEVATTTITANPVGTVTAGDTTSLVTAETVANAINKSGWNAQSAGNLAEGNQTGTTQVNPGDTVTFAAGKNLTVQRIGDTFTYATADDVVFNNVTANQVNVGPVTISNTGIDMGNTRITNLAPGIAGTDAVNLDQLKAARTEVVAGTNVTSVTSKLDENTGKYTYTVNADGASVSAGSNRVTVTKGNKDANNVTDYAVDLSQDTKDKIDNAMSSFTTSVNGKNVETITNTNNDVGFVDGNATKAKDDGGNITFDVVVDEKTINVVNGKLTAVIPDMKVDTTTITVNPIGDVTAGDSTSFATAATVANAINNSGWNVTSDKTADGELGATATVELVKAGETVTFLAGKNMRLTQDGQNFTYETGDTVDFTTITVSNGDTSTYATPITINQEGIDMGGRPITNLKSNLPDTYNNDIYNTNGLPVTTVHGLPTNLNLNNAATVGDILNSGWNLANNGTPSDFVKPYDVVNFVDGKGTKAVVTTDKDGVVSNVTYDINVDGTSIVINKDGQLTAVAPEDTTVVKPGTNVKTVTKDASGAWVVNAEGTNVYAGSKNVVVG
ncbi:beta strand repeat-containing protein, partial [Bergeriella denitrificans]